MPSDQSTRALQASEQALRASLKAPVGRYSSQKPLHGRAELIDRLWQAVLGPGECRVHLLHGLSGSGKTAVAIAIADRAERHDEPIDVWWVKADDALTLQEHMRALSLRLGVSDSDRAAQHPAERLWTALNARRGGRWLLVVDNADDHDLLAAGTGRLSDGCGWVAPCHNQRGTVLVLSRSLDTRHPIGWWTPHTVGRLDPAASLAVLADHVDIAGEAESAERLADRLGGLPLALRLAGALLSQARWDARADGTPPRTIAGYLAEIEDGALRLEDPPASADVRHYVDRPWSISIDFLERRAEPLAVPLLRLLAQLAAAPVPIGDLLSVEALRGIGLPGEQRRDALGTLNRLALVEDDSPDGIRPLMHPLVRDTTRRRYPLTGADVADLVSLVRSCRTLAGRPDDTPTPEDMKVWPAWILLTPHIMRVVDLLLDEFPGRPAGEVRDACFAGNYAARSIQTRGLYPTADAALARIERLALRDLGAEDFETLRCRHIRAVVLHATGRIAEAHAAYDEIYSLRERLFGPGNPETVRSRHYRAIALHALGKYDEAMAEYQAVLQDRIRIAGRDQRHTLATEHNIARLLHDTGDLPEAERRYRDLLERQSRLMGPDYRHTLATRHNLALCLHAQGRFDDAERDYGNVLEIERRLLGRKHHDTLLTEANLLILQAARGRGDEPRLTEVYKLQCEALGAEHPETVATHDRRTNRPTRPGPL
jgi:tetratricopeptide (TPR) repeat protein